MRFFFLLIINFLLICSSIEAAEENFETQEYFSYIIGPGDILHIKVWRHSDLDMEVRVRPDGRISFPLIEDIFVLNYTPTKLKKEIANELKRIIKSPEVTINVVSFTSKKIFVLGEINRPGVYPFEGNLTVLDAISKAGGYNTETANLKSIIVINKVGHNIKPKVSRVNLSDALVKGELNQNIFLDTGSIVFVPKTFISNLNTFIDQFFTKTDPVLKYYLDIIDIDKRTPNNR